MLGHELRNPLAPILTALQLMRLRGPGPRSASAASSSARSSTWSRLVDDLLDVSRIARGKVELKREPVEVRRRWPRRWRWPARCSRSGATTSA